MRFILIGPPGSGKGTQARWMSHHYNIFHLSTGDMLRQMLSESSQLAHTLRSTINKGELIPDEVMIDLLQQRLSAPDCTRGFILDGFPRTLEQAKQLHQQNFPIDAIFELVVDERTLIERLEGRRIHQASGRVYHVNSFKSHEPLIDHVTQEPLTKRADDDATVVKKRIETYHQTIQPVIDFYHTWIDSNTADAPIYCKISSEGDTKAIHHKISQVIERFL